MNKKINPQLASFSILLVLILAISFETLINNIHISEEAVGIVNTIQVIYTFVILGIPIILIASIKDNQNYIISKAIQDDVKCSWKDYFLIKRIKCIDCLKCMIIACLTVILGYLTKSVIFNFYYGTTGKVTIANINLLDKSSFEINVYSVIIALISLIIVPAILEETVFRGIIYNSFKSVKVIFLMFSIMAFCLMHRSILQIPFSFIVGMVCAISMLYTENTSIAILIHMASNFLSIFVIERMSLPFDLKKMLLYEEHNMAMYYGFIMLGLCMLVFIVIIILMGGFYKRIEKENDSLIIKIKDKITCVVIIGIYIIAFVMELI